MPKVALVTGANQGLGLALVRALCKFLGPSAQVYLTARDERRGQEAAALLRAEGLAPSYETLDVTSAEDVDRVARLLRERHGHVDVVISNAAARIVPSRPKAEQVRRFIETNNGGTNRVLRAFTPLLADGARLVVVASAFGRASLLPPRVRAPFLDPTLTLERLDDLLAEYVALVESGRDLEAGWTEWINVPSKVAQVAAVRVVAERLRDGARARDVLVNAVCPGLVDTEASRPWFADMSTAKSPDEAAEDVVWLATLPPGTEAPYGELVQHRRTLRFDA